MNFEEIVKVDDGGKRGLVPGDPCMGRSDLVTGDVCWERSDKVRMPGQNDGHTDGGKKLLQLILHCTKHTYTG